MRTYHVIRWDQWDGGERHNFKAYLEPDLDVSDLESVHKYDTFTRVVLTIFDSAAEVVANSQAALRKAAWHKLDPLERQALGLPVEEPK